MTNLNDVWKLKEKIFENLFAHLKSKMDINPEWKLLEFGIGKYGFSRFYASRFKEVTGLDLIDYSSFHPGIRFLTYDENDEIPAKENSIDIVVSHSVLEHVENLDHCLNEISRILKPNGIAYLTVSPLYYSSWGNHIKIDGNRQDNWEHLDKTSSFYLTSQPLIGNKLSGHFLNKMTSEDFLRAVGRQPWNIIHYLVEYENKPIPAFVDLDKFDRLVLMQKGFRFIGQKTNRI